MMLKRIFPPREGNCFVLMPSGNQLDGKEFDWDSQYLKVIVPVIKRLDMIPTRLEDIYGTESPLEVIWKGIQEAEIVIADLTGRDPNVLYALGLAHVIWKRVILLAIHDEDIPTYLRTQHSCIRYSHEGFGVPELMQDLEETLKVVRSQPSREATLEEIRVKSGIENIPAEIIGLTREFIFVLLKDGSRRTASLSPEDVSWTRPNTNLERYFHVGQELKGSLVTGLKGEFKYSLIANAEDPWPKLAQRFPVGQQFKAVVDNHNSQIGIFVQMAFGINGLIPERGIPRNKSIERGDEIVVETEQIDSTNRRVSLKFIREIVVDGEEWTYHIGDQFDGIVEHVHSDRNFILVNLNDGSGIGLLHKNDMSDTLRKIFNRDELTVSTPLKVEIIQSDKLRKKIRLRDIPDTLYNDTE